MADLRGPPEAEALRLGVLVIGLVLLVPGLIRLALAAYSGTIYSTWEHTSNEYQTYFLVTGVVSVANMLGCVVAGLLLVWISRGTHSTSVEGVLYPTLVIIGAYLLLLAVTGFLQVAALSIVFDDLEPLMHPYYSASGVPYLLGGVALVLIGLKGIRRESRTQR